LGNLGLDGAADSIVEPQDSQMAIGQEVVPE
jgi:hypothetical protein